MYVTIKVNIVLRNGNISICLISKGETMKLSIIIPAYNAAIYIDV